MKSASEFAIHHIETSLADSPSNSLIFEVSWWICDLPIKTEASVANSRHDGSLSWCWNEFANSFLWEHQVKYCISHFLSYSLYFTFLSLTILEIHIIENVSAASKKTSTKGSKTLVIQTPLLNVEASSSTTPRTAISSSLTQIHAR